jgi:hypothetical protein
MTHPLTDEIIHKNFIPDYDFYDDCEICLGFNNDDLRAAYDKGADDRLEQVIEWLKECPNYDLETYTGLASLIHDLKKAMRPQQQEES